MLKIEIDQTEMYDFYHTKYIEFFQLHPGVFMIDDKNHYIINSFNFIQLFGTNHRYDIGMFFVPKYLRLRILSIILSCVMVTKLFFHILHKISFTILHLVIKRGYNFRIIENNSLYVIIFTTLVKIIVSDRYFILYFIFNLFSTVIYPIIIILTHLLLTNTSFKRPLLLFCVLSILTNVNYWALSSVLFTQFRMSLSFLYFFIIVTLSLHVTFSLILGMKIWIYLGLIFQTVIFIFITKMIINMVMCIFNGKLMERIKEKFYLEGRIIRNYESEENDE